MFLSFVNKYYDKSYFTSNKTSEKKLIIIDPGHGLPDNGTVSDKGTKEAELNMKIALILQKQLKKKGFKVILTRNNEYSLSNSKTNNKRDDLKKRIEIINRSNADAVISIHMNYFPDARYSGAQVFYNPVKEDNKYLAAAIQKNIKKFADTSNKRNEKQDTKIYLLKYSTPACVLVECGFLSNNDEERKLNTYEYQEKICKSITKGVTEFFKTRTNLTENSL